jgi:putative pyruvate formate lyase activating enzyme
MAADEARVFRHRVECGEELDLVPSHLFYLSGCNLRCVFCIAEENAFDPRRGTPLTRQFFREAVEWGKREGARNVQWVGGEPSIHLPAILDATAGCDSLPPIVWKSNFYNSPEAFDLLDGVVDVYVADFKFGNDRCASQLADVDRYVPVVTRNLLAAADRADLIVRHLLMPGHFNCCYRPVIGWLRRNLPQVKLSILEGYLPCWRAHHNERLRAPLDRGVGKRARMMASDYGLRVIR